MTFNPGHRQFFYHAPTLGTVVGVYPIDPNDKRFYVDVVPHDNRGPCIKCPVFSLPGAARQLRAKMTVLIFYINGNPQFPVVMGHAFNTEREKTLYHDPLHPEHQNIDDHLASHEETAFYSRLRSRPSKPDHSAPDGSPAQYDAVFNGGTKFQVYEYDPTGYTPPPPDTENPPPPPKPDRAKVTATMPSGLVITADEPATGQSTVDIEHPSGAKLTIGTDGTILVSSPAAINIESSAVTAGAASGTIPLAFLKELQALTDWATSHTHSGVQNGNGNTAIPAAPPTPTGTENLTAT